MWIVKKYKMVDSWKKSWGWGVGKKPVWEKWPWGETLFVSIMWPFGELLRAESFSFPVFLASFAGDAEKSAWTVAKQSANKFVLLVHSASQI